MTMVELDTMADVVTAMDLEGIMDISQVEAIGPIDRPMIEHA